MNWYILIATFLIIIYMNENASSICRSIDYSAFRPIESGEAARIIFFYPGEVGTYMDKVYVEVYSNGMVTFDDEEGNKSSSHIQNCEILWTLKESDVPTPGVDDTSKIVSFRKR